MFDNPIFLWGLLLLIPLSFIISKAVRSFSKFEAGHLKEFLAYSRLPRWNRRILCYLLYGIAVTSTILGLAEPYILEDIKDKQYQNIRLIFVVDVSRSMVYAEDISPNRLEAVKKEIKEFYKSLDGAYDCAILPFAGDTNPYFCPFTNSKDSFLTMLNELEWQSAPTLGTDITKAIEAVKDVYIKKDKIDKSGLNIIILLSDGGKEEALGTNRPELIKLTREIAAKNFKIYTVGVGGDKPCPLVLRNEKGDFIKYVTDENGNPSYSQMDEEILKQLAEIGHGKYYQLNASAELSYDLNEVIKENRKLVSEKVRQEKLHLQVYLFSITVCLLFICLLLNKV